MINSIFHIVEKAVVAATRQSGTQMLPRSLLNVALSFCAIAVAACAQTQVRERSTNYSYTFADMEDRIVLENLARFFDDQDRLPSMADFKQGQVQGTDNVSLGASLPFNRGLSGANIVKNPSVFNIGAVQTQSQDNWTYVPVTDVEDLVRTRCLYKYAVFQSRDPFTYRGPKAWTKFASAECSLGGGRVPVFGYSPPSEPWLVALEEGDSDPGFANSHGQFVYFGTFRSHALWGVPKDFHDFQLTLLGSIPNTAGSTAAGTSPAVAKPTPDNGQFVITGAIAPGTIFDASGEKLTITFAIINSSQKILTELKLNSSRFKLKDPACVPPSLATTQVNCEAELVTTDSDVDAGIISDVTTATAKDGDTEKKSTFNTTIKLNKSGNAKVTHASKPAMIQFSLPAPTIRSFGGVYPQFSPGKSSGPVAPPLASPAQ